MHSEEQRRRTIQRKLAELDRMRAELRVISSGFPQLDRILGGGFPRGAMTEIFGPAACGKTTLALQWAACAQSGGLGAAWIDADHTFDAAYAAGLGVQIEKLPVVRPGSAEEALEMAQGLADSGAVDVLVVDPAAALTPRLELEAGVETGPGLLNRTMAAGMKRLARAVEKSGTAVLFVNQLRSRVDAEGKMAETSAGGNVLKLYMAIRIVLQGAPGGAISARSLKNKGAKAFQTARLAPAEGFGFAKTQ